jgi:hypothetical protein
LTRKVTKVICRFIAAEYDEQGNLLAELPVAAGREEFNACLFFPFSDALTGLIAQIEEGLNAEEGTQDLPAEELPPPASKGKRGRAK